MSGSLLSFITEVMVRTISRDDKNLYQCQACGFHYVSKETAEKCEAWCKRTNSCNLEIIKNAIENKEQSIDIGN